MPPNEEILATVTVPVIKRYSGIALVAMLAFLVFYLAIATPPAHIGWQVFLFLLGGAAFWTAVRMWHATSLAIFLTRDAILDSEGTVLAKIEDIASLDRGVFAFKPSNGFLIRLKAPAERAWRPGLWWRLGRRAGVGGMTSGGSTKFMAEMIQGLLPQD